MTAPNEDQQAVQPDVMDGLLRYLAIRDQQRMEAVNRVLATLRPYERRIVREAAVMGFVRGAMAGRSRASLGKPRDGDIPKDAAMLFEVIDACLGMEDLYPYIAPAASGRRRRVTKSRRWPGE